MKVAVTGVGVRCALGDDPSAVVAGLAEGRSGLRPAGDVRDHLYDGLGLVDVDVRPFLKRRKDRKLLPRAAVLGLPAAVDALGEDRPDDIGLVLGVGAEPPEDATEAAIVASAGAEGLDVHRLGAEGLAAYPPLASLRTLPNLVLAHIAIQLDLTGPGATRAGDGAAGLAAVAEAAWMIHEGRAQVVLAGAADSLVHPGQVRDARRRGLQGPPGEAAVVFRLEPLERAILRGSRIHAVIRSATASLGAPSSTPPAHTSSLGRCGAADGVIALLTGILSGQPGSVTAKDETGGQGEVRWTVDGNL